jgi:hypothetical protein
MRTSTRALTRLLTALILLGTSACNRADDRDRFADLGTYGSALGRDVQGAALETFLHSPEARSRFTEIYTGLHHVADSEALIAGLAGDPALAPLAERVRASIEGANAGRDDDTERVRERWRDPDIQRAVTHTVSGALLAALQAADAPAGEPEAAAVPAPGAEPSPVAAR